MSGTTLLTAAGSWEDMCGSTLRVNYRNRTKVFMRIDQGELLENAFQHFYSLKGETRARASIFKNQMRKEGAAA